ncbi:granulocyte-macrophage colony-stimulating factor receptor subunit alpha-like [Porphyrio hochstetteri]
MFDTLGLICMIWWCMMLFHPVHADIQCTESAPQESPFTNVKMNWRKMELSWESSKNFSKYKCFLKDSDMETLEEEANSTLCTFPEKQDLLLHKGVLFIIEVPNTNISKTCRFLPGGANGSAVENFSCVIYNISFMNCTWQAGRAAPEDTQYFLYWKQWSNVSETECELYIKDENGRNTGCRFQNVMIGDLKESAYFLVNGSSNDSLIRFYDKYIQLHKTEILTPPINITVSCTGGSAGCIITWNPPVTSHVKNLDCFEYEISIQNKVHERKFKFENYNEKKKYILKIRARGRACLVSKNWGEWSEPIEFGQEQDYVAFVLVFLITLGIISVAVLLFCFCKRYCHFKSIFSPIPQPRDKFNLSTGEDTQAEHVSLPKKICVEEVTMVQEMT